MSKTKKPATAIKSKRAALIFIVLEPTEENPHKKRPALYFEKRLPHDGNDNTSWHGVIFPTVGGKVMPNENPIVMLIGELRKKFGDFLTNNIFSIIMENGVNRLILFQDSEITIYGLVVPNGTMDLIRPHKLKEQLFRITRDNMSQLVDVRNEWKHQPFNTKGQIPVFPKHRKAIAEAMKRFYQ